MAPITSFATPVYKVFVVNYWYYSIFQILNSLMNMAPAVVNLNFQFLVRSKEREREREREGFVFLSVSFHLSF